MTVVEGMGRAVGAVVRHAVMYLVGLFRGVACVVLGSRRLRVSVDLESQ